jgi:hypothetical protein
MNVEDPKERARILKTLGADRLKKLTDIAAKDAVPWYRKLGLDKDELAQAAEGWYQHY